MVLEESGREPEEFTGLGLERYLTMKSLPGLWIPEAAYNGVCLAIADLCKYDDDQMREFWRRSVIRLMANPLYSAAFRYLSPRMAAAAIAATWTRFHRGSILLSTLEEGQLTVTLRAPPGLIPPLLLGAYAGVFEAVASHSRFFNGTVKVLSLSADEVRYAIGQSG